MQPAETPASETLALPALSEEGDGASEEDVELLTEEAAAAAVEQVQDLAAENNALRAEVARLRREQLTTLEARSELEVQLAGGKEAGGAREEFRELTAQLELLITENSLLETAKAEAEMAAKAAAANTGELQEALAEAIGSAQRARSEQEAASSAATKLRADVIAESEAREEAGARAARELARVKRLQHELASVRGEAGAAHKDKAAAQRDTERARMSASMTAATASDAAATAREREEDLVEWLRLAEERETRQDARVRELEGALAGREAEQRSLEERTRDAEEALLKFQQTSARSELLLARADDARKDAEAQASSLAARLERQAEIAAQQQLSSRQAASAAVEAHAKELLRVRDMAEADAKVAMEGATRLQAEIDGLRLQVLLLSSSS